MVHLDILVCCIESNSIPFLYVATGQLNIHFHLRWSIVCDSSQIAEQIIIRVWFRIRLICLGRGVPAAGNDADRRTLESRSGLSVRPLLEELNLLNGIQPMHLLIPAKVFDIFRNVDFDPMAFDFCKWG